SLCSRALANFGSATPWPLRALLAMAVGLWCGLAAAQPPSGQPYVEPPAFRQTNVGQPGCNQPNFGQPQGGQSPVDPPMFVPSADSPSNQPPAEEETLNGPGLLFRADHIEGDGVPQIDSITPLQLFPYVMVDNSLFFSDL